MPVPDPARSAPVRHTGHFATRDLLPAQQAHRDRPAKIRRVLQRARPTRRSRSSREGARFGITGTVSRIVPPRPNGSAGSWPQRDRAYRPGHRRGHDAGAAPGLAGAAGRYQPEAGPAPAEHEGEHHERSDCVPSARPFRPPDGYQRFGGGDVRGSQTWSHGLVVRYPGRADLHRARGELRSGGRVGGRSPEHRQTGLSRISGKRPAQRVSGRQADGCPRQDSNLRTRLRRPLLYPLSYGGSRTGERVSVPGGAMDSRGHSLAAPWACCRGN